MTKRGQSDMDLAIFALQKSQEPSATTALNVFRETISSNNINSLAGKAGDLYLQIQTASTMKEMLSKAPTDEAMKFMLAQQGLNLVSQVVTQVFSFMREQEKMRGEITQQFNQLNAALAQAGMVNDREFRIAIADLERDFGENLQERSTKLFADMLATAGTEERQNMITSQWGVIIKAFMDSLTQANTTAINALKEAQVSSNLRIDSQAKQITKQSKIFHNAIGDNPLAEALKAIKSIGNVVSSLTTGVPSQASIEAPSVPRLGN